MPVMREAAGSEIWISQTSEIIKDRQVFLSGATWVAEPVGAPPVQYEDKR